MQLVPNDIEEEGSSETEPILQKPITVLRSDESTSSFEIRAEDGSSSSLADDICQSYDAGEHSNLVNDDQPQCRICLDIGGP